MVQVVFTSPFQDEVDALDVGLTFKRDVPQTVTEQQAKVLLTHPFFEIKDAPRSYAPPATAPDAASE